MRIIFSRYVIILSVFFAAACNLEFPSDIKIKSNATYNFSTGDIKQDFNKSFDKTALFSGLETSADNKVFDYNPDGNSTNCQSFIIQIKLCSLELTVNNLGSSVPNFSFGGESGTPSLKLESQSGSPVEVKMNVSEIFDALKELGDDFRNHSNFKNVPVYIYCSRPTGFSNLEMKGNITFNIGSNEEKLDNDGKIIPFAVKPELEGDVIYRNIDNCSYSLKKDLAKIINDSRYETGNMKVSYSLELSGTTDGKRISDIELYAYIELPLSFIADNKINVDLIKLQGKTAGEDLFGRSEATNIDDMKKFLDVMKTVNLEFITSHSPFVANKNLTYNLKNPAEGTPPAGITPASKPELDLRLNYLRDTVKFSHDDFIDLLENYPQTPSMVLELPKDTVFTVPRNVELIMKVNIMADVDGVIKL